VSKVLNALTVDVEDYFQVSAFDEFVPRSQWASFESRVCANTDRLLEIFDAAGVRGTFFVLGWVAEHYPELVRRIHRAGHELASHSYGHGLVYDSTPEQFRADPVSRSRSDRCGRSMSWSAKATASTRASTPSPTIATAFPAGQGTSTGWRGMAARCGSYPARRFDAVG
jgi:hypothetical protein